MENIEKYLRNLPLNLKQLRKSAGFTQKQLADKLGITYQSYQAYEYGKTLPSLPIILSVAEIFDVSLDSLFGRD